MILETHRNKKLHQSFIKENSLESYQFYDIGEKCCLVYGGISQNF